MGRRWRVPGELGPQKKEKTVESEGGRQDWKKKEKEIQAMVQWPCRRSTSFRSLPHSLSGSSCS